jgi:hypothetical protein
LAISTALSTAAYDVSEPSTGTKICSKGIRILLRGI